MQVMEVVLLVMGLAAFILSFIISEKHIDAGDAVNISEEEIRLLVQEEYERTKARLDDIIDETVNYSIEKAERSLDRISNEKTMALGEYSDTIFTEINKNHQEVVFLSDMLNQNKNDLSILLGQAIKDAKEASEAAEHAIVVSRKASDDADSAYARSTHAVGKSVVAEENMLSARLILDGSEDKKTTKTRKKPVKVESDNIDGQIELPMDSLNTVSQTPKRTGTKVGSKTTKTSPKVNLKFDADSEGSENNNEKILKLHKQGKSNVAIAKELGLGVGEVKLVIDLFK